MDGIGLTNRSTLSRVLYGLLVNLFDLVNAHLTLMETGGAVAADGSEQTLWIENAPLGCQSARALYVDLDNMQGGDTTVLKVYYRIAPAPATLQCAGVFSYTGADGGLTAPQKMTVLSLYPNRFGVQVTLQQTAGTNRTYIWEIMTEA